MSHPAPVTWMFLADAAAASRSMTLYVRPVLGTIIAIASLAVAFFMVNGGIQYMTSSGNPERLDHAKKVIRNALIGLVMVIAAGTLTAILAHAYSGGGSGATQEMPSLVTVAPAPGTNGLVNVLVDAITGLFNTLVQSAAKPFLDALSFFTQATPLMAANSGVFNLWLAVVGITDALFVLVVALLGFHVMSFATFGLEEIEFKHLLPRIGLVFLLVNTSIFAIDAVISLSNGMITALNAAYSSKSVWESLTAVVNQPGAMALATLLIMVVFLILAVILLVYYVLRLVTLYVGAVLSPIVFLLWLLPGFRDFATTAVKTYLGTIFVLFIHVVILELAASIFAGMLAGTHEATLNPIMSMVVGVATILALLKTQSVLSSMSYVSMGARTASKLGGQLSNVVSYYAGKSVASFRASGSGGSVGGASGTGSSGRRSSAKSGSYADTTRPAPKISQAPQSFAAVAKANKAPSGGPKSTPRIVPPIKEGATQ